MSISGCGNFDIIFIMKLTIILLTNNAEKNWNAFRLGNLTLKKGDEVSVFLIGEGVEYEANSSDQFDVKTQVQKFLSFGLEKAKLSLAKPV